MELLRRKEPLTLPVKVLQFGEGNFLRCFVDYLIQQMNDKAGFGGAVRIVQPLPQGMCDAINAQDGVYHCVLRGVADGRAVETIERIDCVESCLNPAREWDRVQATALLPELRFVFSNTTEAGIEYRAGADTFPSKVARLIAARAAAGLPGLIFIPCELIEHNGEKLRECVLRYLAKDPAATAYVERECIFCNTLVDRIVAGYPGDEAPAYWRKLGVEDRLLVCGEPFFFFVIEGPEAVRREFPADRSGLPVVFTDDQTPYRTRKVRLLNGAHTASALGAHLAGLTFVDEMVRDARFGAFLRQVLFEEILPTVPLPEAEKRAYAESVLERFANPYAHHRLLSIALNSVSKWRVRVLPSLLDYREMFGKLPPGLTQSMAFLVEFYTHCEANDTEEVRSFFRSAPPLESVLGRSDFWGMDLNTIPGFAAAVRKELAR